MLRVFCGNDTEAVRKAASHYIATETETSVTRISAEDFQPGMVADALGAHSLFGGKELFVIDTPSEDELYTNEVIESLKEMGESQNVFVVIEGTLLAALKKLYATHAEVLEEFKAKAAERFNTFALADALAEKNKKRLWLLLQEAKNNGLAAEEIIGMLWWQLKALRLAEISRTASEAGMKEFPFSKAKKSLGYFKKGELEVLSESLLSVYHEGHAGVKDINVALEKWVLTV